MKTYHKTKVINKNIKLIFNQVHNKKGKRKSVLSPCDLEVPCEVVLSNCGVSSLCALDRSMGALKSFRANLHDHAWRPAYVGKRKEISVQDVIEFL